MSNQKRGELKRKVSSAEIRDLCSTLGSGLLKHGFFFLFSDQVLHVEPRAVDREKNQAPPQSPVLD